MAGLKTILCIEDDRFISELYARALRRAGYEVDEVVSGPKGLQMAQTGKYDLVLLDLMIPDMTGMEVLNSMRGVDGRGLPKTKVIVTTNLDQDEKTRAALEQKADGYLIKADVTPRKLIELIKQLEQFGTVQEQSDQPATGPAPAPPAPQK